MTSVEASASVAAKCQARLATTLGKDTTIAMLSSRSSAKSLSEFWQPLVGTIAL